ncbi:hypothetical protein [Rathayibacter iranicus]|uniref:hypothetical protein n=1 Tax=Rathayibacter iranicus TaxID=59737 RepID=UPI0011B008FC|nr:hypothetical protein [Rathayibacter iranicus]
MLVGNASEVIVPSVTPTPPPANFTGRAPPPTSNVTVEAEPPVIVSTTLPAGASCAKDASAADAAMTGPAVSATATTTVAATFVQNFIMIDFLS